MSDAQNYVTYDDTGALTGAFLQVPLPDHVDHMIVVDAAVRENWVLYRANAGRDGVELAPPTPAAPVPTAPTIPQQVTMRQARLALLRAGKLDAVTTAINSLPAAQRQAAQIEWDYSSTAERSWPLVAQLAPALGLDDAALDQLFITAAKL